jgi:transposase-like protein
MTDVGRMRVGELVGKVVADEHADVLRQAVCWLAQELMEAAVTAAAGAGDRARDPARTARRNGYRQRARGHPGRLDRAGHPQAQDRLLLPQLPGAPPPQRAGPGRRVQEAHVNGVATRKVDRLVEALGLAGVSKDQVSRWCQGLDEQVTAFRERPLTAAPHTCGWTPRPVKVRAGGRVEHRTLVVAYGVDAGGQREVIGLDVGAAETQASWREFLRWLVRRGLPACSW